MYLDLGIPHGKIGETAQRILDRAVDGSRRHRHARLAGEHILLALAQIEWPLFAEAMREVDLNPYTVVEDLEAALRLGPAIGLGEPRVTPEVRNVCTLALHHATRAGRSVVDAADLFVALLQESSGAPVSILSRRGVDPELVVTRLHARRRELELRDEQLMKRYELPPLLRTFATNLNLLARQDRLPPVFGRDGEIQQVIEILCHRERPNSVMLVGEPGVGKTAIVEGLAQRLEADPDSLPVRLREAQIVSLQMNALVAGTSLRGMFEERLQQVIAEVKERPNLILFVDEAHTMVGAGAALGAPADAANILKSVLARGEVRIIAATTLGEYKEHIQEDGALSRRFRPVQVDEPSPDEARRILYDLRPRIERNYSVRLADSAIDAALDLAPRYMRHLRLPDKAIGWLDTAAVRAEMHRRWDVTAEDVVAAIAQAAQIPADMVCRDVTDRFRDIEQRLQRRVVGQVPAVQAVARRLVLNKGPLKDGFDRPDGVLLFVGPTGVGKTELAKAVAEFLFGDDRKMIRLDMSEYQDGALAVDKLIGMPRGIAGSERGGVLTNQLRDTPYSVVLLDEVEKASPNVLHLFLQAFDEGWITDGRGRRVYLSDALVIMTSNVGSAHFRRLTSPLGFLPGELGMDAVRGEVAREVERRFSPEFVNRIDEVVIFSPLTRDEARRIAVQYLTGLRLVLRQSGKSLEIDEAAMDLLVDRGYSLAYGARFIKRTIDEQIKLPISARWHDGSRFHVRVDGGGLAVEPIRPLAAAV